MRAGAVVHWLQATGIIAATVVEINQTARTVTLRLADGSERGAVPWDDVSVPQADTLGPQGIPSGEQLGEI